MCLPQTETRICIRMRQWHTSCMYIKHMTYTDPVPKCRWGLHHASEVVQDADRELLIHHKDLVLHVLDHPVP